MDCYDPSAVGCLILDLSMPGITGLELQRWLIERQSSLQILFLTGSDDVLDRKELALDGAVEILMKPIGGKALLSAVERTLARNRPRPAHRGLQERPYPS